MRYAVRGLRGALGFTIVAVLTLALGVGATTAVFTMVNVILLRPLPYNDSNRLVRIIENIPGAESITGAPQRTESMNVGDFVEWRARTTTLSHIALLGPSVSMTFVARDEAIRLTGTSVSPSIFPMLGVHPILGRVFEPIEEQPGADRVMLLSYDAWHTYFGGDRLIVGRPITLDRVPYTVVGVMP